MVESRADGQWKRPGRLGLPGPSRLFADRGLGGRNGNRRRKRAEGLGEDVRIGPDLPIVARLVAPHRTASRRDAGLVLPPGFETVVAAGFVGLRHDAHEVGRQLDPCNSGRAPTNRSDRSTNVERSLGRGRWFGWWRRFGRQQGFGRQRWLGPERLVGRSQGFGARRPLGLAWTLRLAWHVGLGQAAGRLQRKTEDARQPRSRSGLGELELCRVDLLSGSQEPRHLDHRSGTSLAGSPRFGSHAPWAQRDRWHSGVWIGYSSLTGSYAGSAKVLVRARTPAAPGLLA